MFMYLGEDFMGRPVVFSKAAEIKLS